MEPLGSSEVISKDDDETEGRIIEQGRQQGESTPTYALDELLGG